MLNHKLAIARRESCAAGLTLLTLCATAAAQPCREWLESSPLSAPAARAGYAMAYDAGNQYTLLWGGVGAVPFGDTWSWNGNGWTLRAASGPNPRAGYQMAFDSTRQKMVLAGNPSGAFLMNTWEWDGAAWNENIIAAGPLGRAAHAMAFDAPRGVMVMFGGRLEVDEGFVVAEDTWEYNGGTWTERTPANHPSARTGHSMAFDVARGVTVLYGGYAADGLESSETWEWDGVDWTLAATGGPPATQFGRLVYDTAAQRVLLYTGGAGAPGESRAWMWNGTAWSLLNAPDNLGYRFLFGLAHDSNRSATVLFGGQLVAGEDSFPAADTWELHVCSASFARGDANCDGSIDFFDIDPFLLALFDLSAYNAAYCAGSNTTVDVDCSTAVDFFDIDPFLGCLFATCPACP